MTGRQEHPPYRQDEYPQQPVQVINQYEVGRVTVWRARNRYDVTVLVNGLPMVHIELKRRGVDIREAFNQIDRYQRDSFWAGSGLFDYVQLFVISNGTLTKYYSNTTRDCARERDSWCASAAGSSRRTRSSSPAVGRRVEPGDHRPDRFHQTFFAKHTCSIS